MFCGFRMMGFRMTCAMTHTALPQVFRNARINNNLQIFTAFLECLGQNDVFGRTFTIYVHFAGKQICSRMKQS